MESGFKSTEYNSGWRRVSRVSDKERVSPDINVKLDSLRAEIEDLKTQIKSAALNGEHKIDNTRTDLTALIESIIERQNELESRIGGMNQQLNMELQAKLKEIKEQKNGETEPREQKILDEFQIQISNKLSELKEDANSIRQNLEEIKRIANSQVSLLSEVAQAFRENSGRQMEKNNGFFSNFFKKP